MGIAKKEQKAKDKLFEITKQYYKARKILMDIRVDYYNRVQNKDISFLDKDFNLILHFLKLLLIFFLLEFL